MQKMKGEIVLKKTVNNLINIAEKEVGYLEKKSNKNLNDKTANAGKNNYTKYNAVFGVNGCYWCAYFICWLFYTLCGNSKTEAKKMLCGALSGACETIRQACIKQKRYCTKNPKPGYLVFFKGTRHKGANHIALVVKVTKDKLYTIEGNTSTGKGVIDNGGGVAKKCYPLTYSKILGYGKPKYESEITTTTSQSSTTSSSKTTTKTSEVTYYKKYTGKSTKVDDVLKAIGVSSKNYGSVTKRKTIAVKNNISNYKGTASQNLKIINLAKSGKLKKV